MTSWKKAPRIASRDQSWTRQAVNTWTGFDTRYAENSQHPIEANLYNLDGLPASPFRTDDLPFPTK